MTHFAYFHSLYIKEVLEITQHVAKPGHTPCTGFLIVLAGIIVTSLFVMSLIELGPVMFGPTAGIISHFRAKGLLAVTCSCSRLVNMQVLALVASYSLNYNVIRCGLQIGEQTKDQAGSDGVYWYCRSCKTIKSICLNSIFTKSRFSLQQWTVIMV